MADSHGQWKFGWKRKIGAHVSKKVSNAFEENSNTEDQSVVNGEVDWLTLAPISKKRLISLEDNFSKSARLILEGSVLAEVERYWEALKKWDEALLYTPRDEKIHDMKAQALMELCESFPAVQSARKAVEYCPTWWVAHQTLGRALLGLGEVRSAVRSFSRAAHLNPGDQELWDSDLMWAFDLLQKKEKLNAEKEKLISQQKAQNSVTITELDGSKDSDDDNDDMCKVMDVYSNFQSGQNSIDNATDAPRLKKLPKNYIQMRDNKVPP